MAKHDIIKQELYSLLKRLADTVEEDNYVQALKTLEILKQDLKYLETAKIYFPSEFKSPEEVE